MATQNNPIPSCSVVIPAHNAAEFITATLDSLEEQTQAPLEIIVIDDGSSDATVELAASHPCQVRIISTPQGGAAAARNRGGQEAKGDFIAFLDADDLCHPRRLERQAHFLVAHPENAMVFCAMSYVDEKGEALEGEVRCPEYQGQGFLGQLLERNRIGSTSVIMMRRAALEESGGFDEGFSSHSEDYDLWLRIAANHQIGYLDQVLIKYRVHATNISHNCEAQRKNEVAALRKFSLHEIQKALCKTYPKSPECEIAYARVLFRMELYPQAEICLSELLVQGHNLPLVYFGLGNIYVLKNQIDRAEDAFHKLLQIDPAFAPAHNNLGVILASRAEKAAAQKHFSAASQINPHYADAQYNLLRLNKGEGGEKMRMTFAPLRPVLKPDLSLATGRD